MRKEKLTPRRIRVLICIPTLGAGGAERVMLFLSHHLNPKLFDITLAVIGYEKDNFYNPKNVKVVYLNSYRVKKSLFKLFILFWKLRPDIVLSSLTHLNYNLALVSYLFPNTTNIARETFVLSSAEKFNKWDQKPLHRINKWVSNFAHKKINYFICQSDDMRIDLQLNPKYNGKKLITINNPVASEIKTKNSIPQVKPIQFITIGRLVEQKGHKRILSSLAKITFPFHYTIIGDGIEKENIKNLVKSLNLTEQVTFIQKTTEVYKYLAKSHIYLQGSFVEGFPNALIESIAIGTPAVVYNAPGGINEIIQINENGFIAETEQDFVIKLTELSNKLNEFTPLKVSNYVKHKYNAKAIIKNYEDLFIKVCTKA